MISRCLLFLVLLGSAVAPSNAQFQKWDPRTSDDNSVNITCVDVQDSVVWMGTEDAGILRFDGRDFEFVNTGKGLVSDEVRDVLVDRRGDVWIATAEGLERWDGRTIHHYKKDGITLMTSDIRALHEDLDGTLWIGTDKGIVRRLPNDRWSLFDEKGTAKGLPSNTIRAIHSGANGILWVATDNGLSSFDGKTWQAYDKKKNLLPSDDVYDVHSSEDGYVWIATNKGIGKYNGKTCLYFLKDRPVLSLTTDLLGYVWAVTKEQGVFKIEGGNEKQFTVKDGIASDEAASIDCDMHGYLWVGHKPGLSRFTDKANAGKIAQVFLRSADERRLLGDLDGSVYRYRLFDAKEMLVGSPEVAIAAYRLADIAASRGDVDNAVTLFKQFLLRFPQHELAGAVVLKLGDLLAGQKKYSEAQLYYQQYTDNYPNDPRNLDILWKMALLLETDGDTFGASRLYQKINNKYPDHPRFDEIRWKIANMEEKQKGLESVLPVYTELAKTSLDWEILYRVRDVYDGLHRRDIMQDIKGGVEWKTFEMGSGVNFMLLDGNNLWVGTQANGVVKWDIGLTASTTYADGLTSQNVKQVYIDADGDLWAVVAGVTRNTLCNMNYSRKKTKWIPMGNPFSNKVVNAILYNQTTKATIAATEQGLMIVGRGGKTYTTKNGLPSDKVKFALRDSKGVLWLIADKYLVQLDSEPKMIVNTGEVDFTEVRGFYIDANDTKWLATNKGVVTYDGTWRQYTVKEGLISDNVQCVVGSHSGKILVGTREGLSFYNKTFWMNYTTEDGLPSNDVRAVLFTEDESIWIGTEKGVHFRKSSGDGDKKLMVQNVLAQEKLYWEKKQFSNARQLMDLLAVFNDLAEWRAFKKALNYEKENQLDQALQGYRSILASSAKSKWVTDLYVYRVARRYEDNGQFDLALTLFADLASRTQSDKRSALRVEEAMMRIARVWQGKGDQDRAMTIIRDIKRLFPTSTNLSALASEYIRQMELLTAGGNVAKTIAVAEEYVREFPNSEQLPAVRLALALAYEKDSKPMESTRVLVELMNSPIDTAMKSAAKQKLSQIERAGRAR